MGLNEALLAGFGTEGASSPMLVLMAQAFEQTMQGMILTDATGAILYVNPAFTQTTGYVANEVIGRNPSILQSGKHDREYYRSMWRAVEETGQWQGEIWNRRKNGDIYIEWLNISSIRGADGKIGNFCAVFSDITERVKEEYKLKAENRKLEQLAMVDALTGVANRRSFDYMLTKEWARGTRSGQALSILFIDIDYFKLYNDLYGHQQGDDALRMVASLLSGGLEKSGGFLARYGGEEFAVILPETPLEAAVWVGHHLRERIVSAKLPHKGSCIGTCITISVGCSSMVPAEDAGPGDLVEAADKALYVAKEKGRNRVQIGA